MNILLISSYYNPHIGGGAEIMLQLQAEELVKRKHTVNVLVLTSDNNECQETLNNGLKIYRCPIKNLYWPLSPQKNNSIKRLLWHFIDIYNIFYNKYIINKIAAIQPDIAICHNLAGWSISLWQNLKVLNIPIIQVIHDYYLLCPNSNMCKGTNPCKKQCFTCKLFTLLNKKLSQRIDGLVCVSQTVMDKICKYSLFKYSQKEVIYNSLRTIHSNKTKIWDGKGKLKVGFIGTLSPVKGVSNLIKAFKSISVDADLYIAGKPKSPQYGEYLKELACNNNNIHFLGYCNPDKFYENIDLAIFPSIWEEPFGLVAIEACAHNIPCIVPSWGGLSEIIHNNINGIYCNSKDIESIKNSIEYIYNNPNLYFKLVSNTYRTIEPFINIDKWIESYESLCKTIILNKRQNSK